MLVKFNPYQEFYFPLEVLPELQALFNKAWVRESDYKNKDANGDSIQYLMPLSAKDSREVDLKLINADKEAAMINHYLMFIEGKS